MRERPSLGPSVETIPPIESPQDYAAKMSVSGVEVQSMEERLEADVQGE